LLQFSPARDKQRVSVPLGTSLRYNSRVPDSIPPTTPAEQKPNRLQVFTAGILVRLFGLLLIWIGDGHRGFGFKALLVIGVILSLFGIGILKWLSFQPRRKSGSDLK
jgi:hypothetical protein